MKKILTIICAGALLSASCNRSAAVLPEGGLAGAEPVAEFNDTIHFHSLYNDALMEYTFDKWAPEDFPKWHEEFKAALMKTLGLTRIERQLQGYTPKAEFKAVQEFEGYTMEDWIIWTEPTMPLPIVVLKPKNLRGKAPLVLAIPGHSKNQKLFAGVYNSEEERKSGEEGQRDIGIQAIKFGYIAIVPTTRALGETRLPGDKEADMDCSCDTYLKRDLLVGRTPIGDRVWDMMKIIDWASISLPIDTRNIIVTGNSAGGTIALFEGALDERVTMSLPGSCYCTFAGSIGSINHCACNYIPGVLDLGEMYDIAGLTAPRLFRAIHGEFDTIFPAGETKKAFWKTLAIYEAAGAPDNCSLFVGSEGHRYYSAGAWEFIHKNLVK